MSITTYNVERNKSRIKRLFKKYKIVVVERSIKEGDIIARIEYPNDKIWSNLEGE